jgi:hypothetical protein
MTSNQVDACRGEGFLCAVHVVKVDYIGGNVYVKCPFCDTDTHYASISLSDAMLDMRPVTCYESGRHGWYPLITETLRIEEESFRRLLAKHPIRPMSEEDACRAWNTLGMPIEVAEECVADIPKFRALVAKHNAKGGNAFKRVYGE